MTSPARLHEAAIVLENDGGFHRQYTAAGRLTFGRRRGIIGEHLWRLSMETRWFQSICVEGRDQLRRYFDEQYNLPQNEENKYGHIPTLEFWKDEVKYPPTPAEIECRRVAEEARRVALNTDALIEALHTEISTWKEPAMTTTKTPIVITTKTLVNGQDIAEMADSQVYDLIARQEADIKELEKIEAKPKKLVAEIEKRRAGIAALVAHLDKTVEA